MRLNGLLWWIDRWRKSTAFMDMTLEEQAAYRNLLDEAWLRGGVLPLDERALAKACGDALRWKAIREVVLRRFTKDADGWHNDTLSEVLQHTERRAMKQRDYRARTKSPVVDDPRVHLWKERARGEARRAVKAGLLTPAPCEVCGKAAQMHHDDYDKPLQVRWLCALHHRQEHDQPAPRLVQTSTTTSRQTSTDTKKRSGSGSGS